VDDEDEILEDFCLFLERGGYVPIPFEKGDEAYRFIEEGGEYDVAVIDLRLDKEGRGDLDGQVDGYQGYQLINLSKRVNEDVPVLAFSAWSDADKGRADKLLHKVDYEDELIPILNKWRLVK